ncbi:GNAT family N-acetyltransferase [Oceanobacillus sp. Castelsardo]|uniref:GNAT family N-acetyltransferase n=1 Tax=Oceanobacillus sp. Castelsardo TaxID=1851204 RepID=UPI0008388E74|nr:GNAT family N-acetyltransferase [Oceanobacillus sp. Castelsardo]
MLIRFKKNMEKIAMGLLSFMPDVKNDVKKLQNTIKEYETNPNWNLYLWKEDDDVLGAAGVRLDNERIIIQHVSVNPSHRNLGIGKKMINELIKLYEGEHTVLPSDEVQEFYLKCKDNHIQGEEQ